MAIQSDSRKKLDELLDLIREAADRKYGPEWGIESLGDVSDGYRNLMHILEGGLFSHFDSNPERPVFRRIVSPTRKFRGDNSDAIYFDAAIRADRRAGGRINAGPKKTSRGRFGHFGPGCLPAGQMGQHDIALRGDRRGPAAQRIIVIEPDKMADHLMPTGAGILKPAVRQRMIVGHPRIPGLRRLAPGHFSPPASAQSWHVCSTFHSCHISTPSASASSSSRQKSSILNG